MNKRFHITIKDNKTGETHLDIDTDCILGAVHGKQDGMDGSRLCGYVDCDAVTIGEALYATLRLGKQLTRGNDGTPVMLALMKCMQAEEEEADGMDNSGENGCTEIPFPVSRKDEQS